MSKPVKLSEIIDGMESQTYEGRCFLNRETGEIIGISDYEFRAVEEESSLESCPEWQRDLIQTAKQILDDDKGKYIALPLRFDIDEYSMMENFALSVDDEISDCLYAAIKERGAFRRFKDEVARFEIEEDWYKFRDEKYKELAIEWCEYNNIEFSLP